MHFPDHAPPIVAILRGITPDEILDVAASLCEAGIRAIEIPLNSPAPLQSIGLLVKHFGEKCLCGAGTVLSIDDVEAVAGAGGRLIVTPNTRPLVIASAVERGLTVMPGFATATEAFRALEAGATTLKLFPAATYGAGHLRALRDVLPSGTKLAVVGGVGAGNLGNWAQAGADAFGIGGDLYKPGRPAHDVGLRARAIIREYRQAMDGL